MSLALGCATTECDPGQGGFVRGVACSADGKYEVRQERRQQALAAEQERSQTLEKTYETTQAEQRLVRAERRAAEQRYAALEDDLRKLQNRLDAAKVGNHELEDQIGALQRDLDLLQQDTFTPEADKQARLDQLQRRKDLLEREVETALSR